MRLRLVVVMRATGFHFERHVRARSCPLRSSASAWNLIFWLEETQPSVLMPATTAAGQTVDDAADRLHFAVRVGVGGFHQQLLRLPVRRGCR
jgi:hypothetical protein